MAKCFYVKKDFSMNPVHREYYIMIYRLKVTWFWLEKNSAVFELDGAEKDSMQPLYNVPCPNLIFFSPSKQ